MQDEEALLNISRNAHRTFDGALMHAERRLGGCLVKCTTVHGDLKEI